MISTEIRERYLRDPLQIRLGGLAADLARVASCANEPKDRDAVTRLLEESKHFAEWAALDAPLDVQATLADVQLWAARRQRWWLTGKAQPDLQEQAQRWADRLLELSGLAC